MFHHPVAFWLGTTIMVAGVIMHLPDYFTAGDMGYRMAGMPMSQIMLVGMVLILGGIGLAAYGLFPRDFGRPTTDVGEAFHIRAMDDAPLTAAHWRLVAVLGTALIVDVMKPATLGFVVPGSRAEYGLTASQVAMFPLVALTGTTIGSVIWGILADRLGRRGAILMASLMFIGTTICGAMPSFSWNLVMCFLMGMSAGGLLPIVFALLAETMPAKQRGWITVLIGGLGTVGGYLAASGAAAVFEPQFNWRVLWFLNLPTGALVIALNRFIPESPRYLFMHGRSDEARDVMQSFGVTVEKEKVTARSVAAHQKEHYLTSLSRLFLGVYRSQTLSLVLLGLAWGLVNWGFLTWLPSNLREMGLSAGVSNGILARSALIAIPGILIVSWLYGHWSSKKSMVMFGLATATVLVGFSVIGSDLAKNTGLLIMLVMGLLVCSSGVIATLLPYSAEVYPTHLRGIGAGVTSASSKFGGIVGPPLIAAVVTLWPGLSIAALVTAAPIAVAAILLGLKGFETRGRRLEEIQSSAAANQKGPKKKDVVIIGGGPAGAAGAMFLAKEGIRSLIVEQESFPRFHIGESLTGAGGKVLRDLGLEGEMVRRRHPIKQGVKVYGNSPKGTWFVPVMGRDENWNLHDSDTWQVRRSEFDKMMLDEAVARGADLLQGRATRPLRNDDGSVRGVEVRMAAGGTQEIESEVILDCSGQATFLADAGVTGTKHIGNHVKHIAIFSQVTGAIRDQGGSRDNYKDNTLIFYQKKFHWAWFIPLDDDVVSVGVVVPSAYFQEKKESKRDFLVRELQELHPVLKRRLPEIKLVEEVHAIPDYTYQVSEFCGKGFICIGDAHRFIDPIFSFGVTVAMREAQFAAPAIKAYLGGAHRDQVNPFADHQISCDKGADVLEDAIDLFWEQPTTFAFFAHQRHKEMITDVFAGRIYERQPSPSVSEIRKLLNRQQDRERFYENPDLYSVPIGSRYHPERAGIWKE
ncbi:MAG: MFS transporter [Nitrospirae bacterium]|nr:MFS transporter [Nitrospirota bacterium]